MEVNTWSIVSNILHHQHRIRTPHKQHLFSAHPSDNRHLHCGIKSNQHTRIQENNKLKNGLPNFEAWKAKSKSEETIP